MYEVHFQRSWSLVSIRFVFDAASPSHQVRLAAKPPSMAIGLSMDHESSDAVP